VLNKFALYPPPSNLNCNPKILSGSKGLVVSGCSSIGGRIVTSLEGAGEGVDLNQNGADLNKVGRSGEEKEGWRQRSGILQCGAGNIHWCNKGQGG